MTDTHTAEIIVIATGSRAAVPPTRRYPTVHRGIEGAVRALDL